MAATDNNQQNPPVPPPVEPIGDMPAPPPPPPPPTGTSSVSTPATPEVPKNEEPAPTTPPPELLSNATLGEPAVKSAAPAPPSPNVVTPPPPKKGFPVKVIGLILVVLALLLAIFFVARALLGNLAGGGQVELTWWGLWEDEGVVAPLIAEYESSHPNVKITYVPQSKEDYRERLTNALARGEGPDIFRYHNTWTPMFRGELSQLPTSVMTPQEFTQTFYPVAVSDLTVGANIVGIPLMYDGLALYINEDIFATYAKTPPTTWTELRDTAIALTIKDDQDVIKQSGIALGTTKNVDHWPEILALMMLQNGADLKKPTGEVAEGALTFYTAFTKDYKVWDDTQANSTTAFAAGKLAMYIAPSWRAHEILEQNPNLKFRIVAIPQLPKDNPQDPNIGYATYWVEGVWERSEEKEEAWEFLKFMASPETLQKFYQNASQVRRFGEPYPRVDMANLIANDPMVGGVIATAPGAKSWYLASRTFDGQTGINTRLSQYFEDAVNTINQGFGGNASAALQTAQAGVQEVLADYGLVQPQPTTQ